MIIKFLFIWLVLSTGIYWWRSYTKKEDKTLIKKILKAFSISAVLGLILISISMLLNNLSGI